MEVCRRSSWLLPLLGVILFAEVLQGVQDKVEIEGPSESECRPYIEKALRELEHVATEDGTGSTEEPSSIDELKLNEEPKDDEPSAEKPETETTSQESQEKDVATGDDAEQPTTEAKTDESTESEDTQDTAEQDQSKEDEPEDGSPEGDSVEEIKGEQAESKEEAASIETASVETVESVASEEQQTPEEESLEAAGESQEGADGDSKSDEANDETAGTPEAGGSDERDEQEEQKAESDEQTETTDDQDATTESVEQDKDAGASVEDTEGKESDEDAESNEEQQEQSTDKAEDSSERTKRSIEDSVADDSAQTDEEGGKDDDEKEEEVKEEEKEESRESEQVDGDSEKTTESVEKESSDEVQASEEVKNVPVSEEVVETQATEQSGAPADSTPSEEEKDSKENKEDDSKETKEDVSKETKEEESKENENEDKKEDESREKKESDSDENKTVEDDKENSEQSGETKEKSEDDASVDQSSNEDAPEEDLTLETDIPKDLRPRDHVEQLLKIDREATKTEEIIDRISEITLRDLKRLYENAIKPLETLYKYRDLSNRHYGDAEIFSKPLILFMGPWSGGKSSIVNYLLNIEYNDTALHTGAEPSPAYFNLLMYGEEKEILDGTQLAADYTFSGLQKFGQGLEERLRGVKLPSKLLEKVNLVEIPGILEVRKQVSRVFPFNDACQWFIDRADIIFLVYDPSKLDVGPETEAILDQLKGREYQTRIVLNKADLVKPEELMRVQGALIWNISPLMSSPQPPIMYTTSLWSRPYEQWAPVRLLQAQERAFLRDLRSAIDRRIENKIASARRFAVRVRNHAKMVDCYLTTYYNHKSIFGNRKKVSDEIIEHPQDYHIYEGLSTLTNISRYDLPDPDVYKDFFRLNPLYEFQQLSATCTYFRGCPINKLDVAIAYDLPELVGKHKRNVEAALAESNQDQPQGS